MWVGLIQSVEGLKSKEWSFPKKRQICLKIAVSTPAWVSCLHISHSKLQHQFFSGFLACQPLLQISDLPAPGILWANSLKFLNSFYIYPIGSVSLENPNTRQKNKLWEQRGDSEWKGMKISAHRWSWPGGEDLYWRTLSGRLKQHKLYSMNREWRTGNLVCKSTSHQGWSRQNF